jgi:hypothetical protein
LRVAAQLIGFEFDRDAHRRFAGPDLPIPAIIHLGEVGGRA